MGAGLAAVPPTPLVATAQQLSSLSPYIRYQARVPSGDGWYALARVAQGDLIEAWDEELARRTGDTRVAGAHLSAWIIVAAVGVWLLPVDRGGRLE